jgi:molybdopterin synthase sulfur carrier subunit
MEVHLYATFRVIAQTKSLQLDLPAGATVSAAVQAVVAALPVLTVHWLDETGGLYPHVHVFLNGTDVATLPAGFDSLVGSTDVLDFFPPVAGGAI